MDAERKAIFWRTWQVLGPFSAVAEAGSYLTVDIAGQGVIAIRGRDGVLRGFKNVCRHRGAQLLPEGRGKCGLIVCPYHKWSYSDTGRLVQAPWFGNDPSIIPEDWPHRMGRSISRAGFWRPRRAARSVPMNLSLIHI